MRPLSRLETVAAAAGAALVLALPVVLPNPYLIGVATLASIYAVLALTWDLLAGYTGEVNLGHAVFFGAGAYVSAFLNPRLGVPPMVCIPLGGLVALGVGLLVGIPCLRLRGPYLGTTTFVLGAVLYAVALSQHQLTGGEEGIHGIQPLVEGELPNYYVAAGLFLAVFALLGWLVRSSFGLTVRAIREHDAAAQAVGINVTAYKLVAYSLSAFVAGVAGSLYAHVLHLVVPDVLSIALTFTIVTMVAVGGIGTLIGPVIGVYTLTFLQQGLARWADYTLLLYGIGLLIIVLFLPEGLWGLLRRLAAAVPVWRPRSGEAAAREREVAGLP
jgi:branched-chain amino acid transport system permease protein